MFSLQPPGPLSTSPLWTLQKDSYTAQGMAAWQHDRTPSYITSNPHFAESTARVLLAILIDLGPQDAPVPIIELGAGSGRFSWLLLRQLTRLVAACPLPVPAWRLIMTDVAEPLLRAWGRHPQLEPFVRAGRLEFTRLDVGAPQSLRLPDGPRIVLANYLWDSIPQDAYEVGGDRPPRALHVEILSEDDPAGRSATELIAGLRVKVSRAPLPDDLPETVRQALHRDGERLSEPTAILVPAAADALLAWLGRGGPVVSLSADKGVGHDGHIVEGEPLPVTVHGGTVSMSVDFRLLSAMLGARGGWARVGGLREPEFIHHLGAIGIAPGDLSRGVLAFDQAFQAGTGFDLYGLSRATTAEGLRPSVERLVRMLWLNRADPDLLWSMSPALRSHLSGDLSDADAEALRGALAAVADNVYRFPEDTEDIDSLIARAATRLSDPQTAARAWDGAIARSGPTPEALHGRAVALSMLGEVDEALAAIEQALAMPLSAEQRAQLSQWRMALSAWRQLGDE